MTAGKKIVTADVMRQAAKSVGAGGAEFGYTLLYQVCGLTNASDSAKAVLRNRVNDLVKAGELKRIKDGVFTYNFSYRSRAESPYRERIWRYVRKQKPGWTLKDVSLMAGASYTHVMRYCAWLEQEGYIAPEGKRGTARTFRATALADKSPEMPQPPTEERSPFDAECRAAGRIVNLMLYGNPYQPKTAQEIVKACKVLLARFDGRSARNPQEKGDGR